MASAEEIEELLEALKAQLAQKASAKAVQDVAKTPAAKEAVGKQIAEIQKVIDKKAADLAEVLEKLPESEWWKFKGKIPAKIIRVLKALGFDIGEAFGEEVAIKVAGKAAVAATTETIVGTAAKFAGAFFVAIADILLDPTPISGIDKRELESRIIKIKDKCYRISFYQTKGSDELIWSDVMTEAVEVECPQVKH